MMRPDEKPISNGFQVPEPGAVLDLTMSDGALIRVRRHGNPEGPRLVLSHGNGFATDAYFPFWRQFLADCDVIVFDQRNHGWNPVHRAGSHSERQMSDDLEQIRIAIRDVFGRRRTAGVFHSLSSTVSLLHFAKYGRVWDSLILVDPPLALPPEHPFHWHMRNFEMSLHDWAVTRKDRFSDLGQLASDFKRARRLRRWVPGAAELMAEAITRRTDDGTFELVCPREFEAAIYAENAVSTAWMSLAEAKPSLFVVSSDYDAADADPPATVCRILAQEFGIEVARIPDSAHLLQIEHPEYVAGVVRRHLRSRRFDVIAAT